MLDLKFIRENPEIVKKVCLNKKVDVDVDAFLELDKERRELLEEVEKIRAEKNKASKKIVSTQDAKEKERIISEMQKADKQEDKLNEDLKKIEEKFQYLLRLFPNIPSDDVPIGESDEDNVVLRQVGEKPNFNFQALDYLTIAKKFDLIDTERAAKISGSRFAFLKREAVLLEFAIVDFVLETLLKENFIPVIPPVMLKSEMAKGTGYFEATDINEAYYFPKDDMFLVGTSEQSLLAMHSGEIFKEDELPKRYVGFSTCFRREAGSYGKDTRGILRVHQFDKLEMFSLCLPDNSEKELELILSLEETMMKELELPYQVLKICTADLGLPAAKKYDIEAWIESEGKYRETHSCSNCTDFQTRRLNIRYKDKNGKIGFVHAINGTAFAIGRILIAIIENYQQGDGSIKIPKVLQKYLNGKEEIPWLNKE